MYKIKIVTHIYRHTKSISHPEKNTRAMKLSQYDDLQVSVKLISRPWFILYS